MLEMIMKNQVLFYSACITIFLGIFTRIVVSTSLKRLVKAASNMNKSNHTLMRLVRAKYEHTCMINDKVQNVGAFVDKYLYEYKVLGVRLYAWQGVEKVLISLCVLFSIAGGMIAYYIEVDYIKTQNYAVVGGAGFVLLLILQLAGNEKGKIETIKMYMIEFLDNTYSHRYERMPRGVVDEKSDVPENEIIVEPGPQEEEVLPVREPEIRPEVVPEPKRTPGPQVEPEFQPVQAAKIREILEEFLT